MKQMLFLTSGYLNLVRINECSIKFLTNTFFDFKQTINKLKAKILIVAHCSKREDNVLKFKR